LEREPATIGERLFALRDERGWSQHRLEEESGVSRVSIGKIEADQVKPRIGTLRKLARALGVSVEELVGGPLGPGQLGEDVRRFLREQRDRLPLLPYEEFAARAVRLERGELRDLEHELNKEFDRLNDEARAYARSLTFGVRRDERRPLQSREDLEQEIKRALRAEYSIKAEGLRRCIDALIEEDLDRLDERAARLLLGAPAAGASA
jgi:transcriptional regulator with XRE-family HTH domain